MSTSPLSPEEIRAAAEVHSELGPEYSDAVVAAFLEKVDREIAARVDAQLAGTHRAAGPARPRRSAHAETSSTLLTGIAIGVAITGIPLLLAASMSARSPDQDHGRVGLIVLWLIMTTICAYGAVRARRQSASGAPR